MHLNTNKKIKKIIVPRLIQGLVTRDEHYISNWSPPDSGSFKLNIDGAFHPESGVGGVGAVIRNDKGEVIW